MFSSHVIPSQQVASTQTDTTNELFINLVRLSQRESTTFKEMSKKFAELQKQHSFRYDHPIVIRDDVGENFYKALEIKGQQAYRFVKVIKECVYVNPSVDGYMRRITIDEEGSPEFIERLFIEKKGNEMKVIFVQHAEHDLFACSNEVCLESGKWYWKGSYLYGTSKDSEKNRQGFQSTYDKMLELMDDATKFNEVHEGLHSW